MEARPDDGQVKRWVSRGLTKVFIVSISLHSFSLMTVGVPFHSSFC